MVLVAPMLGRISRNKAGPASEHAGRFDTSGPQAGYWQVIFQIIILDAVFSLDSIITSVGMPRLMVAIWRSISVITLTSVLASVKNAGPKKEYAPT